MLPYPEPTLSLDSGIDLSWTAHAEATQRVRIDSAPAALGEPSVYDYRWNPPYLVSSGFRLRLLIRPHVEDSKIATRAYKRPEDFHRFITQGAARHENFYETLFHLSSPLLGSELICNRGAGPCLPSHTFQSEAPRTIDTPP